MRPRRAAIAAMLGAVLFTGTACVDLPTSGPVVTATSDARPGIDPAADVDARPPQEGATRNEIVTGFLDAMTSWPIETNVAKQFLTRDAAENWNPDAGTVVYADYVPPAQDDGVVRVELLDADRLDGSGGWRGPLGEDERAVDLRMERQDGEYRIANPPDALLVPDAWFQQRFRQVSLHFLDPVGKILVPEPVFVPIGEQLATSLVEALLAGPPEGAGRVVRTMIPSGLDVGLSVPVNDDGMARIELTGDTPPIPPEVADFVLAQFAWTLRQDPDIDSFRVTVGGEEVVATHSSPPYSVDGAEEFDPSGVGVADVLYGLRDGVLVSGRVDDIEPVEGPLGQVDLGLTSVAVTPVGAVAAGVVDGGTRLVRAPANVEGEVTTLLEGARLAQPSWDASERLWSLDRAPGGAVVRLVEGERVREVRVPGVTGENARRLLVSRDGTRLVALVREPAGDRVVTSRVVIDSLGQVRRAVGSRTVRTNAGPRVLDLAWTDPVEVSLLTPARAGNLVEVTTLPVNGGIQGATEVSIVVRGRAQGLAGTPKPGEPVYAVRPEELVDVGTRAVRGLAGVTTSLDYAG
ncbi:GerMN domain-containing protein [Nocardioides panacisoli]|uniref:LpqB family beta-propeller domain-containing protein n=1 Tax=Nocardioides panacisoli TaxID=627624 RepID=UPI001C6351DE|nr:LpqB family beta-propeller domain-containing protein [Nocardioides panacisoli]QYJ04416.1 GerMN domain-containing protein [Nocardioides panacisoli]